MFDIELLKFVLNTSADEYETIDEIVTIIYMYETIKNKLNKSKLTTLTHLYAYIKTHFGMHVRTEQYFKIVLNILRNMNKIVFAKSEKIVYVMKTLYYYENREQFKNFDIIRYEI